MPVQHPTPTRAPNRAVRAGQGEAPEGTSHRPAGPQGPIDNVVPLHRRHHQKAPYRVAVEADALGNLASYLPGFVLHLQAQGQATKTIEKKITAVDQLAEFLGDPDLADVGRADVERFIADRLRVCRRSSVATTFNALRAFFGPLKSGTPYLVVELGAYDSPMAGMRPVRYEDPVVAPVAEEVLAAVLEAIEKKRHKEWEDVRDAALLRCFIDSGCRLSEITLLSTADIIPLADGRIVLRVSGKGRGGGPRQREVPIGRLAATALRRYLRIRPHHPWAESSPRLWLGRRGPLAQQGVRRMLERRAKVAGVHIHPHQLRHTWAVAMKRDERNRDSDIQHLAGWADAKMLARYGRAATAERAVNAYFEHGAPGDRLG